MKRFQLTHIQAPVTLAAALLVVSTTLASCTLKSKRSLSSSASEASQDGRNMKFKSFREDGNDNFEGIYLRIEPSAAKSADLIYRSLASLEQQIQKDCLDACSIDDRSFFESVEWSIQAFGPKMEDFIFVPNKDMDSKKHAAVIKNLVEGIKKEKRKLQISSQNNESTIKAVTTSEAQELLGAILSDSRSFSQLTVEGRAIDTLNTDWALDLTNTKLAHKEYFLDQGKVPGAGITIAVIDTGITPHPELDGVKIVNPENNGSKEGNFVTPVDELDKIKGFAARLPILQRLFGGFLGTVEKTKGIENSLIGWGPFMNPNHGTSSVSLVASPPSRTDVNSASSALGVTGTAYGAEILVAKISNSVITIRGTGAAAAINWAVKNGAQVISMSVGGVPDEGGDLQRAVDNAASKGVIIVAAAGTGTGPVAAYPAAYPSVVGVTSVDETCKADSQTAYSPLIDVAGPGKNAWFAWTLRHPKKEENLYLVRQAFGTSLSTPHVAGIAGLWLAHIGPEKFKRFGQGNISWLFKYLLQRAKPQDQPSAVHDCDGKFSELNTDKEAGTLGSGVIDAYALLSIDLDSISKETIEKYKAGRLVENGNKIIPPGALFSKQMKELALKNVNALLEGLKAKRLELLQGSEEK